MFGVTAQLDCVGGILHAMAGPLLECEAVDVPQIDVVMDGRTPPLLSIGGPAAQN
jgi:hypothetical protein